MRLAAAMAPVEVPKENDVVIRKYEPSDAPGVLREMLRNYRVESPTYGGIGGGISEEECRPYFLKKIEKAEADGVSFVAVDTKKSPPEIVGVVLSTIEDRRKPDWQKTVTHGSTMKKLKTAFTDFYGAEFFNRHFDELDNACIVYLDAFSVDPPYRCQHLCTRMAELSMQEAAKKSCTVATVLATSFKSQKVVENLGFKTLRSASFEEYNKKQNDEDCKFVIRDPKSAVAKYLMKVIA